MFHQGAAHRHLVGQPEHGKNSADVSCFDASPSFFWEKFTGLPGREGLGVRAFSVRTKSTKKSEAWAQVYNTYRLSTNESIISKSMTYKQFRRCDSCIKIIAMKLITVGGIEWSQS